jgi:hypothetical protein
MSLIKTKRERERGRDIERESSLFKPKAKELWMTLLTRATTCKILTSLGRWISCAGRTVQSRGIKFWSSQDDQQGHVRERVPCQADVRGWVPLHFQKSCHVANTQKADQNQLRVEAACFFASFAYGMQNVTRPNVRFSVDQTTAPAFGSFYATFR